MKEIIIKNITLENFRGFNRKINFFDNTIISGKNESGKTTIYEAYLWLLSGYTTGGVNFRLFDDSKDIPYGEFIRVTGLFSISGNDFILTREVYREKKGDTYVYKIDDIEYSATDYADFVTENFGSICCLSGSFFVNLTFEDKEKAKRFIISDNDYSNEVKTLKNKIKNKDKERNTLYQKVEYLKSLIDEGNAICPICDTHLPEDKLQEIKTKINDATKEVQKCSQEMLNLENNLNELKDKCRIQLENAGKEYSGQYYTLQMFREQKNGEIIPDIIIKNKNNIHYATTNFANKTAINIELQQVFCKKHNVKLPVFIDEINVINKSSLPCLDDYQVIMFEVTNEDFNVKKVEKSCLF